MSTGLSIVLGGGLLFGLIVLGTQLFGRDLDLTDPEKLKNKYSETGDSSTPLSGGGGDADGAD